MYLISYTLVPFGILSVLLAFYGLLCSRRGSIALPVPFTSEVLYLLCLILILAEVLTETYIGKGTLEDTLVPWIVIAGVLTFLVQALNFFAYRRITSSDSRNL